MRHARRRKDPRKRRSAAARTQQIRPVSTGASTTIPSENDTAARRLALIGAADGGTLQRLSEAVREEIGSNNGTSSCARLSAGDVACSCDYCQHFWSRLAERLRGGSEES